MKFAICAIIKNENLYLREWVEYHLGIGFDKIILYDNNDINGEIPNIVIQDYIDIGNIDIYKFPTTDNDYYTTQPRAYNECLEKYKNEYDWIAFIDIDEFIILEKHNKIQQLFNECKIYEKFDVIAMQWKTAVLNNNLYYENTPILKRQYKEIAYEKYLKSIVKLPFNGKFLRANPHAPTANKINIGNTSGYNIMYNCSEYLMTIDYDCFCNIYVLHFRYKSLMELLYRKKIWNDNSAWMDILIKQFKEIHGWTEEHEKVYQKFLKDNNIEVPE